ncbi:MAG: C39 family peptidase [Pseudoxanthomonas sp.]
MPVQPVLPGERHSLSRSDHSVTDDKSRRWPMDERTPIEIAGNYPPRKSTMVRRCTVPIIGEPDEWLFDQVTAELVAFLNTPGLKRDDLFATFRDTAGAFVAPSLHNMGKGRFFRGRGAKAATRLAEARPQSWLDVLRVRDIGPDSFYDMFNIMAVRWVHRFGESLPVFVAADGSPLDGVDLAIRSGPGIATPLAVTVRHGIGIDPATGAVVAFPSVGEYVVANASASIRVNVPVATAVTRVGIGSTSSLRVFHDPEIVTLSVHPAQASYPAKHVQSLATFDKDGAPCGSCDKFAFVKQEDLENAPVLTANTDPAQDSTLLSGLSAGRYVIAGHSEAGIIVTTTRDVVMDAGSIREIGLDHSFDLTRLDAEPPRKAFLQGNVVQQHQQSTRWCGLFSLAHAFSYWAPLRYNPMGDNGQWAGEHIKDGWTSTWLHSLLTYASAGIIPAVASIFVDDPSPGTLQETMTLGARFYGFSYQGYTYDSLGKSDALKQLKRWIHAGVPVIVTIDELMDQGEGHWSSEHYKVLVGYDDDAKLRYVDDDGNEHTSTGAFYFQNSGGQGETRGDPGILDPNLRETHADYDTVPIGNEADSYTVFWQKWKTGGIPTFSDSYWCLPIYPLDFVDVYSPSPDA